MWERGNFLIEFIEQWSQFFQPCNWRTWQLAHIEFEDDRIMGGVEATFVLLGVGFCVRWNHTTTETMRDVLRQKEEIEAGLAAGVPLSDFFLKGDPKP